MKPRNCVFIIISKDEIRTGIGGENVIKFFYSEFNKKIEGNSSSPQGRPEVLARVGE